MLNIEKLLHICLWPCLQLFLVWNVLHKCKVPFDVTWCLLIYYGIKNIHFCIYNLVRHMLTLISKDYNNIKWQFPKKSTFFWNYLVSDQLRTYSSWEMVTYDFKLYLESVTTLHGFWEVSWTAFGHFVLGSHNFMVTALGSCVKWPSYFSRSGPKSLKWLVIVVYILISISAGKAGPAQRVNLLT